MQVLDLYNDVQSLLDEQLELENALAELSDIPQTVYNIQVTKRFLTNPKVSKEELSFINTVTNLSQIVGREITTEFLQTQNGINVCLEGLSEMYETIKAFIKRVFQIISDFIKRVLNNMLLLVRATLAGIIFFYGKSKSQETAADNIKKYLHTPITAIEHEYILPYMIDLSNALKYYFTLIDYMCHINYSNMEYTAEKKERSFDFVHLKLSSRLSGMEEINLVTGTLNELGYDRDNIRKLGESLKSSYFPILNSSYEELSGMMNKLEKNTSEINHRFSKMINDIQREVSVGKKLEEEAEDEISKLRTELENINRDSKSLQAIGIRLIPVITKFNNTIKNLGIHI